jgi:large subunit ribosomal protein L29
VTRVRELRDLGDEDLVTRLDASKEELFNLRFQLATGQLDNPSRIGQVRHEIARILTILRERELERDLEDLEVSEPALTIAEGEDAGDEAVAAAGGRTRRLRRRKDEEAQ